LAAPGESFAVWQLATFFGVNKQHLINLIESGEFGAIDLRGKAGSRSTIRIPRDALISFLESRKIIAAQKAKRTYAKGTSQSRVNAQSA
jgi:hypothetical protein